MGTVTTVLFEGKTAENAQTVQYTSANVTTIIDKFTARNYSVSAATISVNLVQSSGTVSSDNLVVSRTLQPSETYSFPELVGHSLLPGGTISTIAGTASAISIRASGRQIA